MLSQEQLDFYHANGFLLVKGLISREEAGRLRAEAHALIERLSAIKSMEATWESARGVTPEKRCCCTAITRNSSRATSRACWSTNG